VEVGSTFEEVDVDRERTDPDPEPVRRPAPGGARFWAGLGLAGLWAFAAVLLGFRFVLSRAWLSPWTAAAVASWALPVTMLALICALAAGARRRFVEGVGELEWEQMSGRLDFAGLAARIEACRRGARDADENGPRLPPLLGSAMNTLEREASAGQTLDPAGALARFCEQRAEAILGGAQAAVALGLLGSLLGLAVQAWQGSASADASAVFGDDLATGVLVAVSTTIQGVLVAAYAATLERVYRQRFAVIADATVEQLQRRVLRSTGTSADPVRVLASTLAVFLNELGGIVDRMIEKVPPAMKKAIEGAAHTFSQTVSESLTKPITASVADVGGVVGQVRVAVQSLEGAVERARTDIAKGATAVQETWRSSKDAVAILDASRTSLEAARLGLEQTGTVTKSVTEALGLVADRLAAAGTALAAAGATNAPARVAEIDARVAALCQHLEQMLNAVSQLSAHTFVTAADWEGTQQGRAR
jgi:hypothetical protein